MHTRWHTATRSTGAPAAMKSKLSVEKPVIERYSVGMRSPQMRASSARRSAGSFGACVSSHGTGRWKPRMRRAYSVRIGVSEIHAAASAGKRSTSSLPPCTHRSGESTRRHVGRRARGRSRPHGRRRRRGGRRRSRRIGRGRRCGRDAVRRGGVRRRRGVHGRRRRQRIGWRRRHRRFLLTGGEKRRRDHRRPHDHGADDVVDGRSTFVGHAAILPDGAQPTTRKRCFGGSSSAATNGSTTAWSPRTQCAAAPQPPAHVVACSHPAQYAGKTAR